MTRRKLSVTAWRRASCVKFVMIPLLISRRVRHRSSLLRSASSACFRSVMSSESAIMNRGMLSVPGTREKLLLTQIKLRSLGQYCFSVCNVFLLFFEELVMHSEFDLCL